LSVSLIEVAVGVLDDLERFGQFAASIDRRIVQLRRIEGLISANARRPIARWHQSTDANTDVNQSG
jgi:hypothetical protein